MPRNEHERGHEQQELREAERHEHQTGGSAGMELANNPTFHPNHPTKILISPGTGAGWVSWAPHGATDAFLTWMLTYEPLIRGLERREHKGKPNQPQLNYECGSGVVADGLWGSRQVGGETPRVPQGSSQAVQRRENCCGEGWGSGGAGRQCAV